MTQKKKGEIRSVYMDKLLAKRLDGLAKEEGQSVSAAAAKILSKSLDEMYRKESDFPTILVFSNFKGGVSKTTSVKEVGYILSQKGLKVLLIDLDGQSNLSSSFEVYSHVDHPAYISDVLLADSKGRRKSLTDAIVHTEWSNLDLVPANLSFAAADNKIRSESGGAIDKRLLYAIQELLETGAWYDYILIDCPPTADSVIQNAILALQAGNKKSMVIIPINADVQSLEGMKRTNELVETISEDNKLSEPRIKVLWTQVNERTTLFKSLAEEIRVEYPFLDMFKTTIPSSIKVGEARSVNEPISVHAKDYPPALRYAELTEEIINIS